MECITEIITRISEELSKALLSEMGGADAGGLYEIEERLRESVQAVGRQCLEQLLQGLETKYPAGEVACDCGGTAQHRYRRAGTVLSHFGRVRYRRHYYVCGDCHRGQYPLDQQLGIQPGQVSGLLSSELALLGVQTAFGEAAQVVEKLLLLEVSPTTIQQETQRFGALQAAQEAEWQDEASDWRGLNARQRQPVGPQRLYGSIDGVIVPVDNEWRELKVGCWYEAKSSGSHRRDAADAEEPPSASKADKLRYYCDFGHAEQFGELLWAAGYAAAADCAQEVIFVADGATWIWRLVEHYFPDAVQIVDWFHAVAYLPPIAAAAFGLKDPLGQTWLKRVRQQLWQGHVQQVMRACRRLLHKAPAAQAPIQKALAYFSHHAHRMDYARFRQAGYFIGSGSVESACKQIGTQRLKRAGARWSQAGARLVAKARAAWLSGSWPQLQTLLANA
jgi:hypothetical protein